MIDSDTSVKPAIGASPKSRLVVSTRFRVVASVLIVFHLWAIVGRPIEFATQGPFGTSPSATLFRGPVRAYSQFAYLDHGYAFFAPDPGPSHLIAATVTAPDGPPRERMYPDLADQWPRLLYHRHFMLAEFLNNIYHPPGEPPADIADNLLAARQWRLSRRRYDAVHDSIIACLQKQYPEATIAIRRLEHRQPGLPEFLNDGIGIDDPRLVTTLVDGIDPELPLQSRETAQPTDQAPADLPDRTGQRRLAIEEVRPIREERPEPATGGNR